jgi:glycine oxidase
MAMADVTVMGAGVFGLACAFACARRGARVRVLERRRIGAGASGGVVGALSPHVPENWNPKKAFQLDSLLMAEGWWAEVAATGGGDPGYARTGRVQPLTDAAALALAHARAEGAAHLWQGRAMWQVLPLADAPGLPLASPSGHVIHDTLSARVHPARACAALAAAVRALGGTVEEGQDTPPGIGPVIWATGWEGLGALDPTAGNGVKGQALALAHEAGRAPQLFVDGLHIVPHGDGTVAVGSTSERSFGAPDTVDAQLDALHARALAACPALAGAAVVRRWAGVRPRARSRAPVLGAWPGRPGWFVANGGFKIAPKVGEVMADLVLEGLNRVPEGFAPG